MEDIYLKSIKKHELTGVVSIEEIGKLVGVYDGDMYYFHYKDIGLELFRIDDVFESPSVPIKIYEVNEGMMWFQDFMYDGKIYLPTLEIAEIMGYRPVLDARRNVVTLRK